MLSSNFFSVKSDPGPAAILKLSLPAGTYQGVNPDPWLSEGWLLNIAGSSGAFTLRINDTSASITSYDSHLIIALNNASYNNLVTPLSVNSTTIPRTAFTYGTPRPYNIWNWPGGDVYPTWFADTYIFGTLNPKNYKDLMISVTFSNATGARMHFDAYGSEITPPPPPGPGKLTHNGISEDSAVLFSPPPGVQYYLTVTSPYGSVGGQGWYLNGSTAYATLNTNIVNHGNGTRRLFLYWSGDASGTNYAQSNPIIMNSNKTAIAVWKTQYYLTVTSPYGVTGGSDWYNASSTAYASLNIGLVDHGNGTRQVFTNWSGDASGTNYAQSDPILMSGPKTAIANWETQYRLIVRTSGLGAHVTNVYNGTTVLGTATDATPYTNWFDKDRLVLLNTDSPITDGSMRFVFTQWSGDAIGTSRPVSVIMSTAKDITANYKTQYQITVTASPSGAIGGTFKVTYTQCGTTYTNVQKTTTWTEWVDASTTVTVSEPQDIINVSSDTRYKFDHYNPSASVTMDQSKTITLVYKAQYLLTVRTDPSGLSPQPTRNPSGEAGPAGSWWYDASTNVTLTAQTVAGYTFTNWDVDGVSRSSGVNPISIMMDVAHTATAHYITRLTRYFVVFNQTGLDGTATGIVVTINGTGKTYSQLPNSTWVNSGTLITYFYSNVSSTISGKRFNLISVTGPSSPFIVTSNVTITGNYKTEYRLIMSTNSGTTNPSVGEHWYEAGTVLAIQAFAPSVIPGERYVWNGWAGMGNGSYSTLDNPASITMNGPITETASWTHQFLLTIKTNGLPSAYPTKVYLGGLPVGTASDASPYTKWFDAETSTGTIGVDNTVPGATGTQYAFVKWVEDSSTSNPRASETMNAPKTFTAKYKTQYYLTVTSPYDTPGGAGWYDKDSTAYATLATGTIDQGNGTRRVFTHWSGDASGTNFAQSNPITMNAPKTAIANWKTQYLLTVRTNPSGLSPQPTRNPTGEAGPAGSWWYDVSTNVTLVAQTVAGYTFINWDVDGVSQGSGVNPITVKMNAPHIATANYTPPPRVPVGGHSFSLTKQTPTSPAAAYAAVIVLFGVALSLIKRKRK